MVVMNLVRYLDFIDNNNDRINPHHHYMLPEVIYFWCYYYHILFIYFAGMKCPLKLFMHDSHLTLTK